MEYAPRVDHREEQGGEEEGDHFRWFTHTQAEQDLLDACNQGGEFPTRQWMAFFKDRMIKDSVAEELVDQIGSSRIFSPGFQDPGLDVVGWSPSHKAIVAMLRARLVTDPDACGQCPHPDPAHKGAITSKEATFNDALTYICVFKTAKHDEARRQRRAALTHIRGAAAIGA